MEPQHVLLTVDAGIATITIARPEKMNALNTQVLQELDQVLEAVAGDDGIRAAIVTGAGEKAFGAGADLNEFIDLSPVDAPRLARRAQAIYRRLETMGKPFIAAVNGIAMGAALELALACTLRVVAEPARLALPELQLGVIPGYGGTQRLTRLVGLGRALEMMLTGEPVSAQRAYEMGLANRVVPAAELMPTCRQLAEKLAARSPLAVRTLLDVTRRGLEMSLDDGCALEAGALATIFASADKAEGIRAFLEKRPPQFTGR